ncbi:Phosphopantothenate-cysteine ligase /Phosphopantothenoylcysteine decarboxylase [Kytococcus aerolatus]|uniref:Coenzyme A biosynthesis bifunctional protein CoaBC n=1 Tax=Kytococcus aerolatus TaxID=592308 RepID=A0A212SZW5_9MICO|nr:bifunctional phosphopantothenoylcysteine decarboxylase/phosphopantothenate--cysteine ligase CoaBC [Kytococcus aerolatus]SNC59305.1 Phosphopantothenate-cysteine ligase /Phosphopantothenoylcysteine decarboxylase [Kytococcus aerolatus]
MKVVLGVAGGIAAYKAASLLRLFTESGHEVTVLPTEAALRFVGAPTWEALSGHPVATDVFTDVPGVRHVRVGQEADLVVVAPATADLLARMAAGLADDQLTTTLLTATCPVVVAPAMHTEMWHHPATVANVATLRERGVHVIEPAVGRLTGKDSGPGRLPDPELIHAEALARVDAPVGVSEGPLAGRRVVVSAGGTREALDPVRYLGNRSSGRMGVALAAAARDRGAEVVLLACAMDVGPPAGVQVVPTPDATALELAVAEELFERQADVLVMAAAVADFRPARVEESKIKKQGEDEGLVLELERTPDILAGAVERRDAERAAGGPDPVIVGFAAETGDDGASVLEHARAKLARKGVDLLVANEVGVDTTFGKDSATVHLLGADGSERTVGPAPKTELAEAVWDAVQALPTPART